MVLRFISTGNFTGSTTITFQNLMDAWFVAGSSSTAFQLFDFVKIKKVVLRAANGLNANGAGVVGTAITNIGIEYPGLGQGSAGNGKQAQESAMGNATVARLSLRPDAKSQVAQFQYSSANTAFVIRAKEYSGTPISGAICDVHCVFRNSADISPAALQNAIAGGQSGQIYFGGLDGKRAASTEWRTAFIPAL